MCRTFIEGGIVHRHDVFVESFVFFLNLFVYFILLLYLFKTAYRVGQTALVWRKVQSRFYFFYFLVHHYLRLVKVKQLHVVFRLYLPQRCNFTLSQLPAIQSIIYSLVGRFLQLLSRVLLQNGGRILLSSLTHFILILVWE